MTRLNRVSITLWITGLKNEAQKQQERRGEDALICSLSSQQKHRGPWNPLAQAPPPTHRPEKPGLVLHIVFLQDPPPLALQLLDPLLLHFRFF